MPGKRAKRNLRWAKGAVILPVIPFLIHAYRHGILRRFTAGAVPIKR